MPAETTLVIQHQAGSEPPLFRVTRLRDGKSSEPAPIPSPTGFPVEGRPNSDLPQELRWYLEQFLDYPFHPETDHAERVQAALKAWGTAAFEALIGSRDGRRLFDDATAAGYSRLTLQVSSDDARILAWPWEALYDPEAGFLAHACRVERKLNKVRDPVPLPESLPQDRINILLVISRPYEGDVRFRSLARPVVELIETRGLPAEVHVLRPPTLDALREHLRERPGYYHLLHFDGHGSFRSEPAGNPHTLRGPEGRLIFEDADGKPAPVTAEQLTHLLRDHAVPAVLLSACQTATMDDTAEDPFASVAAALLRAGIRSVVAMAYSLYVSGAQHCLPAFYQRLFEKGSVAEAVRAGRQEMLAHKGRVCARGEFDLDDWLVPVLYQQDPLDFSFAKTAKRPERINRLPEEVAEALERETIRFIGRDGPILELERALRRAPAGILIQGMGGAGKTTLARNFLHWLDRTGGLGAGAFWFNFIDIRSAEYVFNRLGNDLFGPQFSALPLEQKLAPLVKALRENRLLVVWDNFEPVCGIPGVMEPTLPSEDRELLSQLLLKLRGGKTKVLITSRSPEDWLGHDRCYRLRLGGLVGEEQWEFCTEVLRDLGLAVDREQPYLRDLIEYLKGHPLMMRAVLPRLADAQPSRILEDLKESSTLLGNHTNGDLTRIFSTLRLAEKRIPLSLRTLLIPLSLHDTYTSLEMLEMISLQANPKLSRKKIETFIDILQNTGLVQKSANDFLEIHPILCDFVKSTQQKSFNQKSSVNWRKAFTQVIALLAQSTTQRGIHDQTRAFGYLRGSFHNALREATLLQLKFEEGALIQCLGSFALNSQDFTLAHTLFERLLQHARICDRKSSEASALHQLGRALEGKRELDQAEYHYRASIEISNELGDQIGVAASYHQLGSIAEDRRDDEEAESLYREALRISKTTPNNALEPLTYGQLAHIASRKGNWQDAEQYYKKALSIFIAQKLPHRVALTYSHLAVAYFEQENIKAAEQCLEKGLKISETINYQEGIAFARYQIAAILERSGQLERARKWMLRTLEIQEHGLAKSETILTYNMLGIIAAQQGNTIEAGGWLIKAALVAYETDDHLSVERSKENFLIVFRRSSDTDQSKLTELWEKTGIGSISMLTVETEND